MAQPIPCDLCEQALADLMITVVTNGDTLGICLGCVPAWAEVVTQHLAAEAANNGGGGDPAELHPHPDSPAAAGFLVEAPDGPAEVSDTDDEEWAAGYPQGRSSEATGPPDAPPDDEREDSPAAAASDVAG